MMEKKVTVNLPNGLHARPATIFVQMASSFASEIKIMTSKVTANGKSIMGIMAAGIKSGAEVVLTAEGSDEADALSALEDILSSHKE